MISKLFLSDFSKLLVSPQKVKQIHQHRLTVEEHLRFFANLKTGEQIESRKEIDKMIEDLGLSHKRHDISEQLSGGMKRKLSIGAAFIGNSK